jgi:hypothetical protein
MEINLSNFSSINTTHHLLLDETQKNVHMEAVYRYQTQLNYVDDGLFPLLSYHNILKEVKIGSFIYLLELIFYSGFKSSGTCG